MPAIVWQVKKMKDNKTRVMHVLSDLNFGGAGKYLLDICRYIDKGRFEILAVLPEGSVVTEKIQGIDGVEICSVKGIDNKSFDIEAVKELRQLIKDKKPTAIHAHACLSARVAGKLENVENIVYTRHCVQPKSRFIKKTVKQIIGRLLSNKAIAVSKAVYDNLIEEGERPRDIELIYNGVDISSKEYDRELIKEKYGIADSDIVITLVGRLEEVKGQDHMIEIAKELSKKSDGFKVLMVGEGSHREKIEERIDTENLPIMMTGHVDEIDEIYEVSDIVVNTSNSEALSFAVIEGFSHRKPAVAFNIEGLKEVVEDGVNGYLVEFKNYGLFAEKLQELIKDKSLREQFGKKGLEKAREKFSVSRMVSELENIYEEG